MSDGGTITSKYVLDIGDVQAKQAQLRASLQGVQQSGDANVKTFAQMEAELKAMSASFGQAGTQTKQAGAAALSTAQAEARLAVALGDRRRAIEILEGALVGQSERTNAVINAETQLTQIENQGAAAAQKLANAQGQASNTTGLASQAAASFKSNLVGMIGPAALVTAGFQLLKGAVDLTEESFKFKAALDTTNLSIQLQLKNFRDVNQTLAEGRQFAERYNITQKENADSIQASIPLLRQSKASLTDVEGVLARLAILKPEQGIRGAAFALGELEGGQARSLATRFNIPIAQATELKNKIRDGADAVQVMNEYLNSVGLGMDTLDTRTKGATGKMLQLEKETENLQLALAGQSGGIGEFLLDVKIKETQKNTRILSGDLSDLKTPITNAVAGYNPLVNILTSYAVGVFKSRDANAQNANATADATHRTGAYDAAVQAATASLRTNLNALSEDQREKLADKIETAGFADQQAQLDRDSRLAAQGLLGAGDQAVLMGNKYGIAADQAQFLIDKQQKLSNATALADQRVGERDPSNTLTAAEFNNFDRLGDQGRAAAAAEAKRLADEAAAEAKRLADKAAQDAARLADLQFQNRLENAKDGAAKIAVIQAELNKTTDPIKRQELQNRLDQERNNIAKAHTTTLDKNLKLTESTYDSIQKQKDALLDIEELTIKDRQADRNDAQKRRTNDAILRLTAGRTDQRALDFAARARDANALIDVQDRQRANELEKKNATANATIGSKGQLLQSKPGDGSVPVAAPAAGGTAPTGATAAAPGGTGQILVQVFLDSKQIGEGVEPYLMDQLMKGIRAVAVSKGA